MLANHSLTALYAAGEPSAQHGATYMQSGFFHPQLNFLGNALTDRLRFFFIINSNACQLTTKNNHHRDMYSIKIL